MKSIEAIAIDKIHLELQIPLSEKDIGKRYVVHISEYEQPEKDKLKQLELAYLSMTESEKQAEINLAEEGLKSDTEFLKQFENEKEEKWWE